jgi:hypothetical protein
MGALFDRYVQLELGTTYDPPAPAEAERLKTSIKDVPEPPRRVWTPPPAVPAPTPAHAAVAQRIIRGDRRPQE